MNLANSQYLISEMCAHQAKRNILSLSVDYKEAEQALKINK